MSVIESYPYHLKVGTQNYKFDIELRGRITQVAGYSGTGKTLLCDTLKDIKSNIEINGIEPEDEVLKHLKIFNFSEIKTLEDISNSLVVIDKCEFLGYDKKLVEQIISGRSNAYILIGRGCLEVGISPNYKCNLERKGDTIYSKYTFSVRGWY